MTRQHHRHAFALVFILLLVTVAPAPAEDKKDSNDQQDEPPKPVKVYMGRRVAQTMHWLGAEWLIRQRREREERASVMLANLGVKSGMTVCDLGCGNGFHTLKLAAMVGKKGRVLGVDIQKPMLDMLMKRAKQYDIENITPVLGLTYDPKLKPGSCDIILLVDVYHEFDQPEPMLKAMRKALNRTGRLVLVEFRMEDPDVPIKLLHKMSKPQIAKELTANGYKLVRQYDKLPWQHMMFFERDDSPTKAVKLIPWQKPKDDQKESK